MTNEEKIEEILNCKNCKKQLYIGCVKCPPTCADYNDLMQMAQWKDEQLKQTLDEHLEHATGERAEAFMDLYRELFENV